MKDQPLSPRHGCSQRSKIMGIVAALALAVILLLGTLAFLSYNKGHSFTKLTISKTPLSPGIYIVTNKNYSTSQISKADARTHKILWAYTASDIHASSLTVTNNTVYYSTYNRQMSQNTVYALDANTGTVRWKMTLTGRPDQVGYLSQPIYAGNLLYVIAQSKGTVTALDSTTGKISWTYNNAGIDAAATSNGQLALSGNTLYGIIANRLFMLNASTGKEIGKAIQIDQDKTFLDIKVIDDTLYARSSLTSGLTGGKADSYLYAFDAKQGTQRWLYHSASWISQSIFSAENIYFIAVDQFPSNAQAGQGKMTLSALSTQGKAIWHKDVLNNGSSNLVAGNGLLYLGYVVYDLQKQKDTPYLQAFQSTNGESAWIKQVAASPSLVQRGILYTGLAPCQIGAFDAQSSKELWHQQYCVPLDDRDLSTPDFVVML